MSRPAAHGSLPETERYILFNYKGTNISADENIPPPTPIPPLELLDRHITEELLLKRVVVVPELHRTITQVFDAHFDDLATLDDDIFGLSLYLEDETRATNSLDITHLREDILGHTASNIASRLILHPSQPNLNRYMGWGYCAAGIGARFISDKYASQDRALRFYDNPSNMRDGGGPSHRLRVLIAKLLKFAPYAIAAMFMCTDATSILEGMSGITDGIFPWKFDAESTATVSAQQAPPDAPAALIPLPVESEPRRSSRLRRSSNHSTKKVVTIRPIPAVSATPTSGDYIQKVR